MKLNLFAPIAVALMSAALVGQTLAEVNPFLDDGGPGKDRPAPAKAAPGPAAKAAAPGAKAAAPAAKTATAGDKADASLVPAVVGLPPATDPDTTYRIAPDDQIEIKVFQVEELSTKERVSEKGTIVMPLVGPIQIAGLTPDEAEKLMADTLGRDYLQDPHVDIDVVKATNMQVTVTGSVKKPGVFPLAGRTTLMQAIALAEGPDRLANREEVIVFRPDGGGKGTAYVVDLDAVQRGDLEDPILTGNDRIVVPESGTAVFLKGLSDTLRGFVHLPLY
jgi:polysaccharide export outer membrane protein